MDRRSALGAIIVLSGVAPAAFPQAPARQSRLGILGASTQGATEQMDAAFFQRLRDLGYREGDLLAVERRYAGGSQTRLPVLARELVAAKVDLIFAPVTPAAVAAQGATKSIPIVFAVSADPVGAGLVDSLAHPGRNATGLSSLNVDLTGLRLSLLKELAPKASRVAILVDPESVVDTLQVQQAQLAVQRIGADLHVARVGKETDYERAFRTMAGARAAGVLVIPNPRNLTNRAVIIDLAARLRMPALYGASEFVRDGGLLSYSPDYRDQYRRAAVYVAQILRGAEPANLPVEQPSKFELVINLKTAKALRLAIPQSVLLRADEVIE